MSYFNVADDGCHSSTVINAQNAPNFTTKGFPFFRMGTIKLNKVEAAIKHNRRAIQAELDGKHWD